MGASLGKSEGKNDDGDAALGRAILGKHINGVIHIGVFFKTVKGKVFHFTLLMGQSPDAGRIYSLMNEISNGIELFLKGERITVTQSEKKGYWFVPTEKCLPVIVSSHMWLIEFLANRHIHLEYCVPTWMEHNPEATAAYESHKNAMAGEVRYPIVCHATKIDGDNTKDGDVLTPQGVCYFGGYNQGICVANAPDTVMYHFKDQ